MKVNGNAPTFDFSNGQNGPVHFSNIPIRLEIASRILAAAVVKGMDRHSVNDSLHLADWLITEHNKTCEGKCQEKE